MDIYLVGGAVRDELLGRPAMDRDWVVVGGTTQDLLEKGYQKIGNDFPCFLHPKSKEEYSLARSERKSGPGHIDFVCDFNPRITLEEDLSRRDLSINAIAKTIEGDYIDPYGGRADLKAGVLRHVSDAFAEDPLRVVRVARFAARYADLGFTIHPTTYSLISDMVDAGAMSSLTPERIWKEMLRALTESRPSEFFRVLRSCGALPVLFPGVDGLFATSQLSQHCSESNTPKNMIRVIDIARQQFNQAIITWATLLHDFDHSMTHGKKLSKNINHISVVQKVCEYYKVPRDYRTLAILVSKHHMCCHNLLELRPKKILNLLEVLDVFRRPERARYFSNACEAIAKGRLDLKDHMYPQAALLMQFCEVGRNIDIQPLLNTGYQGPKLAEEIRLVRLEAIRKFVDS